MLQDIVGGAAFAAMRAYRQFVVYLLVARPDGKTDKFTIHPSTGRVHDAHDPAIWLDAQTAAAYAQIMGPQYGVGFVFTSNDPFFFVDIDGALSDAGVWSDMAGWLLGKFRGACIEVSQSGRGLHIFGTGAAGPHRKKNTPYGLEYYTELRFAALTGNQVSGDAGTDHTAALAEITETLFKPVPNEGRGEGWTSAPCDGWRGSVDDADLIRRARNSESAGAKFGTKASFAALWDVDADALGRAFPHATKPYDESSADMALAMHLMFWTGRDCERVERLMRASGLARAKWDDRGDYYLRDMTIRNAFQFNTQVCEDAPQAVAPGVAAAVGAPTMQAVTGSTFFGPSQQVELFAGCVYVADVHRVLVPGGKLYKPDQFRAHFGGFSFMMDDRNERTSRNAFEAFTESQVIRAPRADATCFQPTMPPAVVLERGGLKWTNIYWPIATPRQEGDASPFTGHMARLLPDAEDRRILTSYLAACVQYKGSKFQWAPLLQGVQGNGKTLFSLCVAEALGQRYVHWPKASKLSKDFNGWMLNKLLYCVEDIYTPQRRQEEILEDLKPMITGGKGLEIESKGVDQISADICGNFIFNMNKPAGLRRVKSERRYAFFLTPQQKEQHVFRDGMGGDYFPSLYGWLAAGGFGIVHNYLATYPIPVELNPALDHGGKAHRAPITSTTPAAIHNSAGRVEQEIAEAIAQGRPGFARGWVSSTMLGFLLKDIRADNALTLHARAEMLEDLGYMPHPGLHQGRSPVVIMPDGKPSQLWVLHGHPAAALDDPHAIAKAYEADNKI